ncbi:hypothetical protein GF327_05720 [Candidatus Woesearchaeota archaeon]|nr:hypothetical protein [Candidatus Woesearchaeota archaeon]
MKKNLINFFLIFLLGITSAWAADLSDYPDLFEDEDLKIVAVTYDENLAWMTANDIKLTLDQSKIVSPREIDNLEQNLILIGNACINPLVDELKDSPENCRENLSRGGGRISLYEKERNNILVIEAYDKYGLFEARNALNLEIISGKTYYVSQERHGQPIGFILLRKNRLNHLIDEYNITHTFKFTGVDEAGYPIIEIDGVVSEKDNVICPYDLGGMNPGSTGYASIEIKKCYKPDIPDSNENLISDKDIKAEITPDIPEKVENKSIITRIILFFLNLFA